MPIFQYEALLSNGKKKEGFLDAESLDGAKAQIKKRGLYLTKISSITPKEKKISLSLFEQMIFLQDMAKLLKAGIPLYETLLALEEKYRQHKIHLVIVDLHDQVKGGHPLSLAMKRHPLAFEPMFSSMVTHAEKVGNLEEVLEDISEMIKKRLALKKQIVSALLYPGILLVFCFIVLSALFFYVVPSLAELFEGRELHPLTATILSISNFLRSHFLLFILFLQTLVLMFFFSFRLGWLKKGFCIVVMQIPFARNFWGKLALVRFTRAFGALLQGGMPCVEALSLSKKVMNHPFLEKEIEKVEKGVVEGKKLSELFKESSYMPDLVSRMLAIAEEGGNLAEMLFRIASLYEDEVERAFATITVFLQPILLLILGGIVGIVVLSVLLPLTDVSSFLST